MASYYEALKAELIAGHPGTGVYDVDDQLAADQLNAINRTRNRTLVTGKVVKDAFDGQSAEWAAIGAPARSEVLALTARDDLNPFGVDAMMLQEAVGANAPNTLVALIAYRVEDISRAVEIGYNVISAADVYSARSAT